ncbi:LUD domain-containing protein [Streptomyces europaeiscabiei]|uniref:LutC/YkgG family protein n=1 Tax=Streptomyces TaxID=1883 RepID=UPI000A35FEE3|nr:MULTISPECIES: LUD domain-containing protein [Streptomyces]MDX3611782.1 LUD domain-containing protein [Streptomyces europaeiscabiei]MDX3636778.1 LUD domain-containing protein [Streptomyces europaeiscabiei]MDX3650249.1 LUD domain-containing protein [Streptomyces europaeiscabiei]
MSGRDTVLRDIRSALADVPGAEAADGDSVPHEVRSHRAGLDVVELFIERAADYRATVVRVRPSDAVATVGRALARTGAKSLVVPPGFPEQLVPEGPWSRLEDVPPLTVRQLDAADAVLTTVAAAIALTGTVVLDSGPGQGRRALTLLPDQHVCVVRASRIAADVPEALSLLHPYRPLTLISGPSATSDIELDRVEGVHGPRTLDIVVVTDE